MFWDKNKKISEDNNNKRSKKEILKFLLDNFGDSIEEDLFDDFDDYVKYRKGKMDIDQEIEFFLENFRDEIEEGMFNDFEDYVQFRRAIKEICYD